MMMFRQEEAMNHQLILHGQYLSVNLTYLGGS